MPAWVIPAISAAAGLIGQGIAAGKDKRQLTQQKRLNDQQIEANDRMLGIQNKHALQMWEDTNYNAQKDQMKKAGINPALLYGMGGGGGTTTATQSANVSAPEAKGRTGRETEETTAMAMQIMSQTELLKAQKENVEADTENKKAQSGYTSGAQTEQTKAQTELTGSQKLKTDEEKDSLAYDNIIKELLVNRDENGNLVEEDKNRLAFKQKTADYIKTIFEQNNIGANTAAKIAEVAQKWKGLELEERKTAVMELTAGEQKDEDQMISLINTVVGVLGRFIPGGRLLQKGSNKNGTKKARSEYERFMQWDNN